MPHATTPPFLRLLSSNSKTWEDPTSTQIYDILSTLNLSNCFLILEKLDIPVSEKGQHYIQVYLNADLSCLVEHREGGADRHFQADVAAPFEMGGHDIVARVFISWALGNDVWREELEWRPLVLEETSENGNVEEGEESRGGGES